MHNSHPSYASQMQMAMYTRLVSWVKAADLINLPIQSEARPHILHAGPARVGKQLTSVFSENIFASRSGNDVTIPSCFKPIFSKRIPGFA